MDSKNNLSHQRTKVSFYDACHKNNNNLITSKQLHESRQETYKD